MNRRLTDRGDQGAVAVVVAICATLLLGLAAFGVDLGNAYARTKAVQASADFAALAGADGLPTTSLVPSTSDPVVQKVVEYLNANQPASDGDSCVATNSCVTAIQLVDSDPTNGDVDYVDANTVRVTTPGATINFGLASVLGFSSVDVQRAATAQVGTPDGVGMLPMYVAQPTPGNPACDYGLQTLTDPPNGQVVPPAVPELYLDAHTNGNSLEDIDVFDGGAPVTTVPIGSTTATITIDGDFTNASRVGFFKAYDTSFLPIELSRNEWTAPAGTGPYSQNNGSITVALPTSVTSVETLWYVRVYQAGSGGNANKWSARAEALPLSVGDAPFECVGGSSSGNFGTIKLPRGDSGNQQNANGWIPRNVALGLEPPLTLAIFPGSPPPWECTGQPAAVFSTASTRLPGTNCVDTDTGLTSNTATPGFIMGGGSGASTYKGLLDTGSSSEDPDGSGGCSPSGNTNAVTVNGKNLNNDLLTCFFTDTTTQIGDVARRNYAGGPKFSPAIYKSPRFAWVPVFGQEAQSGGSNRYSIVDFRPTFIADQPMNATKGNNAVNSGTINGLGTTGSGGGFKLQTLKVIFLNKNALPDGDSDSPLVGPPLGQDFPKVFRLID